jgi:4a-hydroxytetrahydrobiopterin dehydratase
MPHALSAHEVQAFLASHQSWFLEGQMLVRKYQAPTFLRGIAFVTALANAAEKANHHPDIDIRWCTITVRLVTHDAGNSITALDTQLAGEADQLFTNS